VVTNKPIELAGLVRQETAHLFAVVGLVILALFVTGRVQKHIVWPEALSGIGGKSAVSVVQFGGLAVASLVIGLVFHSTTRGGFLRYPDGVVSMQRAHTADFVPRIELNTAKRLSEEGGIFVDARNRRDFEGGHVDGAISIPVDANDILRRDAMKAVPLGDPVVVYCQSEACQFADTIAGKLRLDGFSNVSVLRGGWIEWSTGESIHVRKSNRNSGKWKVNSDGTASPI
jgi:rhodanese-related sulfurtransferase